MWFWTFKQGFKHGFFGKKLQHDFLKMREGAKGQFELFRKITRFGSVTCSLWVRIATICALLVCKDFGPKIRPCKMFDKFSLANRMVETENIKKNWKPGWFPIEKVADRMVEPKHPAYGSQETSRRSAATLSQLQSWRNFSKPFPFVFSIWMSTFLIASYLENLLKTAFFSQLQHFSKPTHQFSAFGAATIFV